MSSIRLTKPTATYTKCLKHIPGISVAPSAGQDTHLHEKDGVKYHERFRQSTGDVGVFVESKHARPRRHWHGLDVFHVAAVRVFRVVINAGVDAVFVEGVVRVEYLET